MKLQKQKNVSPSKVSIIIRAIGILLLVVVSLFIYVSKVLDPLYPVISVLCLYIAYRTLKTMVGSYIPSARILSKANVIKRFTLLHKTVISLAIIASVFFYTVSTITPNDKEVFSDLSNEEQTLIVNEDVEVSAVLMDKLVLSSEKLLANPGLVKRELTQAEALDLKHDWESFILESIETERMTDRHRYFSQISMFTNKDTHIQSFVIAYSLYIKKFEIFHKVIAKASENPTAIKIFNEHSNVLEVTNMYDDVTSRFFASNSFLRRNVGYVYFRLRAPETREVSSANYASLLEVSNASYEYIFKNAFSQISHRSIVYKDLLDRAAFETWLPIQKTVITDKIGNIHVGDRTAKFITTEQIVEMKKSMAPGDIMVYRKNWYASNLGIPGFWTHAGLYTGPLEDMDAYFADRFPRNGHASMSALLEKEYPSVYQAMMKTDKAGFVPSVIESQTHGTLIQSVESSAAVDYIAVTRPKLSKEEKLVSLLSAFAHFGKSYDYAFDLDTKGEIYCSELVYDAYLASSLSKGVIFPKVLLSGRLMVIPNAIVEKFAAEYDKTDSEQDFVYFLDASEVTKKAFKGDVKGFIQTLDRPKYSTLLE